jgi:hypothetical protein
MKWDAGSGKEKPTLPKEEPVEISIKDNHGEKRGRRENKHLSPE